MALNPSDYGRRVQLTGLVPASPLNGFVALATIVNMPVEAVDQGTFSALNGGGDLAFSTDALGVNQLPLEVVTFVTSTTPANRQCQLWVRFPTYSTAARSVYMFYNRAGQTQPPVTAPFGRNAVWSDYYGVFHFTTLADSSGNLPDLTPMGGISAISDSIFGDGYACAFQEYLTTSISAPLAYPLTMTAIAIDDASMFARYFLGTGDSSLGATQDTFRLIGQTNTQVDQYISGNIVASSTGWPVVVNDRLYSAALWNNDSTQRVWSYSTGNSLLSTGTGASSASPNATNDRITIGASGDGSLDYSSLDIYEARYAKIALSDDRLQHERDNTSSPSTFWITGTPETPGGGITVTVNETGPSFTESINTNLSVNITGNIAESGPSFTESVSATLSALTIQAVITESGPSFNESISANVTTSLTINASISETGPSFTESISANLDTNLSATINELGPSFTESINVSTTTKIIATITEFGPSFSENIVASIPIKVSLNPRNSVKVKRKSNAVKIKRKSNNIRVK